ncbi:EF-hand calcium-binding domain protein, putative [Talaromyces stipitatus ATCC 10500]|uniref:EF-hand calcium-binding domain protein, putative n=1 Tax=Talaromyces stipitatus (strain ATCC 10500 / CBS 375.48 / QM 6759 / NRRL 1006) TaxID=441959 RepID=B8M5D4_TALSN|nr:EF-hand calcium-binding domain protein, putative [Talaromyces stipitatus ATCC 10500]EED19740.1 EF-hand calcium-binding domain protein, putative [Talaromyces stipitatus ATCC 10500]
MGRKIRILGLHGYGTSGAIFSSQTTSFRRFLQQQQQQHDQTGDGDEFDFDFANGPLDSGPAAGIELFYNPPYYQWWPADPTLEDMTKARERLKIYLKQNGPYDGVIMFSQGCTLGASLLLEHYKETPQDPPPFKFAIFICGGPSLKQLEAEFGFTIDAELWEVDRASRKALARRADTAAILAQGSNRWQNDVNDITDYSIKELVQMVRGPYQIRIPTVHVVGAKDPRNLAGHQLHALSHPDITKIYEHEGGHDIPRNETTSTTIARLVRWVSSSMIWDKAKQINGI